MNHETNTAEINGAQIYYEISGSGPPLLLLHAGVADSRMWASQIEAFSESYRVIRFDLRGCGRSNMPPGRFSHIDDVKALLDFLNIQETYLLGISFGGLIALDFSLAFPAYVKAIILGAPSISGNPPTERIRDFWEQEETAAAKGEYETAADLNVRFWVDGPHRQPDEVDPAVRQLVYDMQLNIFQKDYPDDLEEIGLEPAADGRLKTVRQPVLVMVGSLDLEEKVDLAHRLAGEIPNCELIIIPEAAHMLNMEKPELFNRHVLDFLAAH